MAAEPQALGKPALTRTGFRRPRPNWPRPLAANAVRLQLHALTYNLGNFARTLAMPETAELWSLTTLRQKLVKTGARVVSHGRYVTFQMAEVAVPREMSDNFGPGVKQFTRERH